MADQNRVIIKDFCGEYIFEKYKNGTTFHFKSNKKVQNVILYEKNSI
jgi:hypothetical protein